MIISGFSINIRIGIKCSVNRIISDDLICGTGADIFIVGPWFVVEYRYRE